MLLPKADVCLKLALICTAILKGGETLSESLLGGIHSVAHTFFISLYFFCIKSLTDTFKIALTVTPAQLLHECRISVLEVTENVVLKSSCLFLCLKF